MPRSALLKEIASFMPQDGFWLPLDDLLISLWEAGVTNECLPTLFGVFERFPDEDGGGVLWSIVHGIETSDIDYNQALRDSMSRQSSFMGRIMLDRLERANAAG
jgi:hypothetical protein